MGCLYSCLYRSKLRAEYDLGEGECPDFLVHCCCEHLALCQEYRELKNHGFDLGIGKRLLCFSLELPRVCFCWVIPLRSKLLVILIFKYIIFIIYLDIYLNV